MDTYKGQHLYIKKAGGSYTHHGLGIGGGMVIHYSGLADGVSLAGEIERVLLEDFAQGQQVILKNYQTRKYSLDDAVLRAGLRLGESQYHVLHNNCEHFVEWCISGNHRSSQSRRGKLLYSLGMGTRALIGVKNPVGFVAGAVAGYAYIQHQGRKKIPDFDELEERFNQLKQASALFE